jgi:hypothetical protein
MSNKLALALIEYMKLGNGSYPMVMQKYDLTPSEFWSGFAQLRAKAPR